MKPVVKKELNVRKVEKFFSVQELCVQKGVVIGNPDDWFEYIMCRLDSVRCVERHLDLCAGSFDLSNFCFFVSNYGLPPSLIETFIILFLKKIVLNLKSLRLRPSFALIKEVSACVKAILSPLLSVCCSFDEISSRYRIEKAVNYVTSCVRSNEHSDDDGWSGILCDIFEFHGGLEELSQMLSSGSPQALECAEVLNMVSLAQKSMCIHCGSHNRRKISEASILCIINLPIRPPFLKSQDPTKIRLTLEELLEENSDASTFDACVEDLQKRRRVTRTEILYAPFCLSKCSFASCFAIHTSLPVEMVAYIEAFVGFKWSMCAERRAQ
jgi:hypothetical protein